MWIWVFLWLLLISDFFIAVPVSWGGSTVSSGESSGPIKNGPNRMKEAMKPKNVTPPDPEAKNPQQPTPDFSDHECKPYGPDGIKDAKCTSQASAFSEAASAASYLGFYYSHYSRFGEVHDKESESYKKTKIAELIEKCIVGNRNCEPEDKKKLATAKIQYNIGKYIRNMLLEANTYRENMRTPIAQGPDGQPIPEQLLKEGKFPGEEKAKVQADKVLTSSFKLSLNQKPEKVEYIFYEDVLENGKNKQLIRKRQFVSKSESDVLGADFLNRYGMFLDTVSNSGIDNKLATENFKKGFVNVHQYSTEKNHVQVYQYTKKTFARDPNEIAMDINAKAYEHVSEQQEHKSVQEGVESIKQEWINIKNKPKDFYENEFNIAWPKVHGNEDPYERAKVMAKQVNDQITKIEKAKSAEAGQEVKYIQLNVAQFDQFLDSIWPPSEARRKEIAEGKIRPIPEPTPAEQPDSKRAPGAVVNPGEKRD